MNRIWDVAVAGGGVIGLAVAYELVKAGCSVVIVERGPLHGEAVAAAAGMLGAEAEAHQGDDFFRLCLFSRSLYRSWAAELEARSSVSIEYRAEGIIRAALDEEEEQELRARGERIPGAVWMDGDGLRRIEPELSPDVRGGYFFADDHQVHPVRLAEALRLASAGLGVRFREHTPVLGILTENGRAVGLRTTDGDVFAEAVVVAAGAWSSALLQTIGVRLPVEPVKGQCYALSPDRPVIRKTVYTRGCYIVPKADGSLWIGATQEYAGFDKTPTAAAVAELHQVASALLPVIKHARFVATWTGLRPGTPDGLPWIGPIEECPGLFVAAGHFRNGILLAPATGRLLREMILGEPLSHPIDCCSPNRTKREERRR